VIRGQHGGEYVGSGEGDFGQRGVPRGALEIERVLEVMRQFAELAQAAGGGVAFQCVHGATDGTNDLLVAGMFFELQSFFVQRLQQFLRGLEEKIHQLGVTFLGRNGHSRTSIRW